MYQLQEIKSQFLLFPLNINIIEKKYKCKNSCMYLDVFSKCRKNFDENFMREMR